ncbi:MAG: nucleotide exchange factor GrpE [Minisyncoccia bacterium]
MISSPTENEDIDFEPEDELGGIGALKAKLQKLRDELAEVKKERSEYLDGWQRAKADVVNVRREATQSSQRSASLAREAFIAELIPALDSFDMAMAGEGWKKVDAAWRSGVESINAQISSVLQSHGVESFGKVGEVFDAMQHEAIQEVDGENPGTVAAVLRRGYRIGDRILRPAHVSIVRSSS